MILTNRFFLWALTAGHCLPKGRQLKITAELGKHYTDRPATSRKIKKIIVHEKYRKVFKDGIGVIDNDIGLIQFDKSVKFDDRIRPACLPDKDLCIKPGTVCVVTGWGYTDEKGAAGFPTQLQQAPVKIFDNNYCKKLPHYGVLTDNMLCAGWEEGEIDACGGDSGGPLSCKVSDDPNSPWVLAGTVSWGIGCARKKSPGVYSFLPMYSDWIRENTNIRPAIVGKNINNGKCLGSNAPAVVVDPEPDVIKELVEDQNKQCLFHFGNDDVDKFGRIKSPDHPRSYSRNSSCKWCFTGDTIKIRFKELKTNQQRWWCDPNKDRFTFEDKDGKIIKTICFWKHIRENFSFSGKVCLNFNAKGENYNKPMKYRFEYTIQSAKEIQEIKEQGGVDTSECPLNGHLTSVTPMEKRVISPNYPRQYPDGLHCRWTIQSAVKNFPIKLLVEKQNSRWERGCQGDRLTIYSGLTCQEVSDKKINHKNRKYARTACGISRKYWLKKLTEQNFRTKYCIEFRSAGSMRAEGGNKHFYQRQSRDSGFSIKYQSVEKQR